MCAAHLRAAAPTEGGETYRDDRSIAACQDQLTRYAANVNSYRACLVQEMERVIRDVNSTLDRFNCRTSAKGQCR